MQYNIHQILMEQIIINEKQQLSHYTVTLVEISKSSW